ncbi:hypothetical protein FKG94_25925 [Exilibacterium tricleocarpae]|uniref:Heparin-sulfate lyase N-terminal domain-containing protein n=1 Tax=Exilibacterium tricleocarpae TaxID=2591008 RepID=A0A545SQI7_9GAMM|nr:hypothetical protein [Exilibacterium tricleocarpae]TQV67235.1 hypothetical protein FKG94_25925 [Exilibacterium tricleocarpae]
MSDIDVDQAFSATTSVQDFKLKNIGSAPAGYPQTRVEDSYTNEVFAETYDERKAAFIEHALNNPGSDSIKGMFYELIRLQQRRGPVHEQLLFSALGYIDDRLDCADFVLTGIVRLYYQFLDSDLLSDDFRAKARQTILDFKYWPDEPGTDSMCYWTENHHILFSTNEYLAGQLFPDSIFTNSGMSGRDKQARALKRIEKWLELRFFTGFSEWLSNVYYDEDLPPLLNLLDFAGDKEVVRRARLVIDLMLYDMAINSYYGLFACTHGRTYTKEKINPYLESTTDTAKLLFGMGSFANEDNMSAVMFALSDNYELPKVIFDIATDTAREEWVSRQRVSIKFRDAKKWGYGKFDLESAMGLLSFGGYCHHRTFNHMALMLDEFRWWENGFFLEFVPSKRSIQIGRRIGLTTLVAWLLRKDISRNVLDENNIYTYRTPDYMLSTSQAFRPGYGGDQQHIWQATLDGEAVCFTTHPGGYGLQAPEAYWHGNGFMPKAVQHKNVAFIFYNVTVKRSLLLKEILDFTHAFFPRQRFDRVVEQGGWVFGEKKDGFIALYSGNGYRWQQEGEYSDAELIAPGRRNIWVVEMGRRAQHGSFEMFIDSISSADIVAEGLNVRYCSPSQGPISAGWSAPLRVEGKTVSISDYKRYDNPSCTAEFGTAEINIAYGGEKLSLKY